MSTPPLPPPGSGSTTSTQEIPVVPAAVANTQHLPPPPAPEGTRTTGPVEFVPEPPATTTGGKPATRAATPARRRLAVGRGGLVAGGLAVVGVAALELGLSLGFGGRSSWSVVPLWSAFATVAAALVLLAIAGEVGRGRVPGPRRVGAAGLVGLGVHWLLVGLPLADSDRGFLLTAGVAALVAAYRLVPARPRSGS